MRHRIDLPAELGNIFSVRDAARLGIRRGRLDATDLARPFRGVRTTSEPTTFPAVAASCAKRMQLRHRFGGITALRCWGMPVPWRWHPDELLTVVAPTGAAAPRAIGIRGVRLAFDRAVTWRVGGLMVVDPIAALFTSARDVKLHHAIVMIDALLTTADNYPGLRAGRPVISARDIEDRLNIWGPFPGCQRIREALGHARAGVESPKETETRLLIVGAGLPEPVVQYEVSLERDTVRIDLAYPELKIAIEYEGDGHRTDQAQWRRDIRRQRELEDRGWIVIRLTQHDLGAGSGSVLARIRRAIDSRASR